VEERTSGFKPIKKKKGRFNLVDLLLVLIVLAIVFVVVFVVDPFSIDLFGKAEQNVTLEYTVRIDNVEGVLVNKIQSGDEVVDAAIKNSLGYVSAVENDIPHTEPYYDAEAGAVSMKEYPDRYDLLVTVTAKATFAEGRGYAVNDRRVAVGSQLYLMFPDYVGTGNCISIREIG
jgi:hypothetical protein